MKSNWHELQCAKIASRPGGGRHQWRAALASALIESGSTLWPYELCYKELDTAYRPDAYVINQDNEVVEFYEIVNTNKFSRYNLLRFASAEYLINDFCWEARLFEVRRRDERAPRIIEHNTNGMDLADRMRFVRIDE